MVRKTIFMLALAGFVAAGICAQEEDKQEEQNSGSSGTEWYNSYAPSVDSSKVFINLGIGLGSYESWDIALPPISVSADIKLPIDGIPITIGPTVGIAAYEYHYRLFGYKYDHTLLLIAVGVRGMYHFNWHALAPDSEFLEKLDTYAGLTLGWVIATQETKYTGSPTKKTDQSFFLYGFDIGARYFFTPVFGVFTEFGYTGLQYVSLGLTLAL